MYEVLIYIYFFVFLSTPPNKSGIFERRKIISAYKYDYQSIPIKSIVLQWNFRKE